MFHPTRLYLFVLVRRIQGALEFLQVSPEEAALGLQPVPVESQLGGAGLLLLQTVRQARQLKFQISLGLLQLDAALLRCLGALLLLQVGDNRSEKSNWSIFNIDLHVTLILCM